MKSRGLIVGLVVLTVLVGLLYWSNRQSAAKTSDVSSSVPAAPKILALNQADIIKVEVKKKGSDDVVLSKNGSGNWQITSPKELGADSNAVSSLLSTVSSLNAERVVDDKAGDLQPYGLAPPSAELVITENGNKSQRLLLGDDTPTHGGAYAALAGDSRVFTIASFNKTSLDKSLNDFRDKRFLTIESSKVNRLELVAKSTALEFDHDKDHWQILKPKPSRADSDAIDTFLRNLADAKIDPNQAPENKSFQKAETVGTVKVTSDTATQELNVRKIGNDFYATSSVQPAPYKISNDVGQEFTKPVDDFRNKKLFDFGFIDPAKIEFKDGTKSYFLTKGGDEWWGPDGKKLESAGAYSFLDKIRELKADKFAESGFGNPVAEITVTPNSGGQPEKVLIAKDGANYMAKRDNDSSLYLLDAKLMEGLEKSAADMKPAADTKPPSK